MVTKAPKDVAAIIFGRSRGTVLSLLFGHIDEMFYLRQIVRASGFGLGPVQRELKLLTEAGIINRTVRGRQVYFQANTSSPIFPELKSLITKTAGIAGILRNALTPVINGIEVAFIYGSIARGQEKPDSDIDLLVVGDATFSEVVINLQAAQHALGREINPTVYPASEFRTKIKENHHFIGSVINGSKIFLIGGKDELERLVGKRLAR